MSEAAMSLTIMGKPANKWEQVLEVDITEVYVTSKDIQNQN